MSINDERREELREEKKRKKKGDLKVKAIKYVFGNQIIKFEKRMFGWHYVGHTVDDDVSYEVTDKGKIRKKHNIIKYSYFNRPKVWKGNFLFNFTEIISNLISFFRRVLINAVIFVAIILYIINMDNPSMFAILFCSIYGGLILGSFAFAGLGYLWKKVFKLEEQTDEVLTANGFDVWSANEDGELID